MRRYILDTNHLGAALDAGPIRDRIKQLLLQGCRLGTCIPVLCELEVGIRQTARRQRNRLSLHELMKEILVWPVDRELISVYADIRIAAISRRSTSWWQGSPVFTTQSS